MLPTYDFFLEQNVKLGTFIFLDCQTSMIETMCQDDILKYHQAYVGFVISTGTRFFKMVKIKMSTI